MRDVMKDHSILTKNEFKKLNGEMKALKKENIEILQKIGLAQTKVADLELFIGFERKIKK